MQRLAALCCAVSIAGALLGCSGKVSDVSIAYGGGGAQGGDPGTVNGGNVNSGGLEVGGRAGQVGDEINVSGTGGSGGASDSTLLLTESSWDITVTATWVEPELDVDLPLFPLTLALRDEDQVVTGILSRDGRASAFELIRQSGARVQLETKKDTSIPFWLGGDGSDGSLIALQLKTLTLTALDDDADGVADRLVGTGGGTIERSCGDCSYSNPVALKVSGTPDRTAPRLNLTHTPLNPLDEFRVSASEALLSGKLELGGIPLISRADDGNDAPPIWFSTPVVLPFSGAWKMTGVGRDFVGQVLDLSTANVTTLVDPGVFAQDGFETAANVALTGEAAVVDASSGLPIPSGSHALLLPPGSAATFHLQRTATASKGTVSVRFVELSADEGWRPKIDFRAAVIGGKRRDGDGNGGGDIPSLPTTHAIWIKAAPAYIAQVVLNEMGGGIGVLIAANSLDIGPWLPPGALLIDELKLE